ncbi:dipeptidase [Corynebacterium sp. 13CS0277]|nr:dipeptidase [Corynebacterium sp. 13CS0277]
MTPDLVERVRGAVNALRPQLRQDLAELVAFNSVALDPATREECVAAAEWVAQALSNRGLEVQAFDTADGSRALVGRKEAAPGQPTVLLYSHYDVVSAGDPAAWTSDPFTLTERDGRWYGRGTADCKGNLVMHLAALRVLEELHPASGLGITVLIEGSEEQGGEGLDSLLAAHPELFTADAIMIADTGNISLGEPTLTTTLRGGAQVTVTVSTLRSKVHSGSFGGAAPDAAFALVRLLDSLRNDSGAVVIDGVDCTGTWEGVQYDAETFRGDATVLEGVSLMGEGEATVADQVWARPAVTITGLTSTPVAEAVNAVPNTASAQLNLRVPPGMRAQDVVDGLVAHLRAHVPWGAHLDIVVDSVNDPFQADTSGPGLAHLAACLSAGFDGKPTLSAGTGGSIPLCTTLQQMQPEAEIALYGVEEPLCTIHAVDESVSPDEIAGITVAEALFLLTYTK